MDSMFLANAMVIMDAQRQQMQFHNQPMDIPPQYHNNETSWPTYQNNYYPQFQIPTFVTDEAENSEYESMEIINVMKNKNDCLVKFDVEDKNVLHIQCEITNPEYMEEANHILIHEIKKALSNGIKTIKGTLMDDDIYGRTLFIKLGFIDVENHGGNDV